MSLKASDASSTGEGLGSIPAPGVPVGHISLACATDVKEVTVKAIAAPFLAPDINSS
jgi:hypothetical protein